MMQVKLAWMNPQNRLEYFDDDKDKGLATAAKLSSIIAYQLDHVALDETGDFDQFRGYHFAPVYFSGPDIRHALPRRACIKEEMSGTEIWNTILPPLEDG